MACGQPASSQLSQNGHYKFQRSFLSLMISSPSAKFSIAEMVEPSSPIACLRTFHVNFKLSLCCSILQV